MSGDPLLDVQGLTVEFATRSGPVRALDGVSLAVGAGEIVGLVGESGSGKSATALAIMGLLDPAARVRAGRILLDGRDLLAASPRDRREAETRAAMVFQNPRAALNPIRPVGRQIADVIARHRPAGAAETRARAVAALAQVRVPDPERRARSYPFELSGGLCQRVGIAVALASSPRLLIADEPTTGLDVTTQAVVMDLIATLARERGMSVVLITHDLALASHYCDRLVVMHAGQVVETAPTAALLVRPRHPYTERLLRAVPSAVERLADLRPLDGALPDLRRADLPPCRFAERCDRRRPVCDAGPLGPEALGPRHAVACRMPL